MNHCFNGVNISVLVDDARNGVYGLSSYKMIKCKSGRAIIWCFVSDHVVYVSVLEELRCNTFSWV